MKIDPDENDIIRTRYPNLPYILSYLLYLDYPLEISVDPLVVNNSDSSLCRTSCIIIEPHFDLILFFSSP
jgi:hypothetical protein